MKSPLRKRIFREVRKDWKKYIVLTLLMAFMIALASGVNVANDSMMAAIDESYEKYNIESGHFELKDQATPELLEKMSKEITIYEQFYKDSVEDFDGDGKEESSVRLFKIRKDVNLACIMEGRLPEKVGEIAIDRNHATNRKIKVGDIIYIGGEATEVVGLVSNADYSTLYKKNSDFMFNAVDFDVALLEENAWEEKSLGVVYEYAYKSKTELKNDSEKKEFSDKLMEHLAVLAATGGYTDDKDLAESARNDQALMMEILKNKDSINELKDFVPEYANQAIHFAPNDMGSDKSLVGVLVYVFIFVLAFVFAITTSNTITSESAVIGTLRATGYTRGELVRHYMLLPILVTLLASVIGNILGYTYFKDVCVDLYYNSYSLMTYETRWNASAFLVTTVLPCILMFIVNIVVIYRKLRLSPLKFLRHDLSTSKRKKARRLPSWRFMNRFRLRILLNNMGGYLILFCGIAFVMLLLAFSTGLPETLNHYKDNLGGNLICNYQYILKNYEDEEGNEITTDQEGAEKYSVNALETIDGAHVGEEITVYGYSEGSRYVKIDEKLNDNEVWVTSPYKKKFRLKEGDVITLKEKYENTSYEFVVKGVYDYDGGLAVFLPQKNFNKIFGHEKSAFSGYFSQEAIHDIDSELIYSVITLDDIMSIATQLDHSMGGMMDMVAYVCLIMAVLIMYLLTKIIIEKNSNSISMIKVLGYENGEINSLYILLTSIVVVFSALATAALAIGGLYVIFRIYMGSLNGWFDVYVSAWGIAKMILILVISYAIVAFFDMIRIKRIPLADALKNVE